ncbi:Protein CBG17071 [Caenorhabditis briggsae]|uniref:Protein CBG17071 n=1 Tax=Caenorhabditis briggsae TaxID=6238 RepID=A8XQG0_CAEBR|nr:Protein CBG17071 [Caenorhabditis briggsae]CAP34885.1 Protein CBG17071 [Caenorhabditis briggsae]
MEEEDICRTFGPLWTYFYRFVVEPIVRLSLDRMELKAIIWILFFDHAYNDISSKSTDLCWSIRKVIHRELRNYLIEKFSGDVETAENRFLNLLEIPMIVERGEQKFQEEVVLFQLNRVKVHEDFVKIMKKQRI